MSDDGVRTVRCPTHGILLIPRIDERDDRSLRCPAEQPFRRHCVLCGGFDQGAWNSGLCNGCYAEMSSQDKRERHEAAARALASERDRSREQVAVEIEAAIEAHKDRIAAVAGVPRKEGAFDSAVENGMRRAVSIARGES